MTTVGNIDYKKSKIVNLSLSIQTKPLTLFLN